MSKLQKFQSQQSPDNKTACSKTSTDCCLEALFLQSQSTSKNRSQIFNILLPLSQKFPTWKFAVAIQG